MYQLQVFQGVQITKFFWKMYVVAYSGPADKTIQHNLFEVLKLTYGIQELLKGSEDIYLPQLERNRVCHNSNKVYRIGPSKGNIKGR